MLAQIVGSVDNNSALVLVAFFAMCTVVGGIWFAKRRARIELTNDHELAKIKEANAQEILLVRQKREWDLADTKAKSHHQLESERIQQGLIASHTRDVSPQHSGGDEG